MLFPLTKTNFPFTEINPKVGEPIISFGQQNVGKHPYFDKYCPVNGGVLSLDIRKEKLG